MVSVCSYVLVPLAASGCARSALGDCVRACALAFVQNRIIEAREQEEKDRVERERAAAEERKGKTLKQNIYIIIADDAPRD